MAILLYFQEKTPTCPIYSAIKKNCQNTPNRRKHREENVQKEHISIQEKKCVLHSNIHTSGDVHTTENLVIASSGSEFICMYSLLAHMIFIRGRVLLKSA